MIVVYRLFKTYRLELLSLPQQRRRESGGKNNSNFGYLFSFTIIL